MFQMQKWIWKKNSKWLNKIFISAQFISLKKQTQNYHKENKLCLKTKGFLSVAGIKLQKAALALFRNKGQYSISCQWWKWRYWLDFYKEVSFVNVLWLSNKRKHQHKFVTMLTLFAEPRPQTNSPQVLCCLPVNSGRLNWIFNKIKRYSSCPQDITSALNTTLGYTCKMLLSVLPGQCHLSRGKRKTQLKPK